MSWYLEKKYKKFSLKMTGKDLGSHSSRERNWTQGGRKTQNADKEWVSYIFYYTMNLRNVLHVKQQFQLIVIVAFI